MLCARVNWLVSIYPNLTMLHSMSYEHYSPCQNVNILCGQDAYSILVLYFFNIPKMFVSVDAEVSVEKLLLYFVQLFELNGWTQIEFRG